MPCIVICENCGEEFGKSPSLAKKSRQHFCSIECSNRYKKGRSNTKLVNRVEVCCYYCTQPMQLQPWRLKKAKRHFCSRECQFKWQKSGEYKEIHSHRLKRVELLCSCCGGLFEKRAYLVNEKHNFCSMECRNTFMSENNSEYNPNSVKEKVLVNCMECENSKYINESVFRKNKNGHYCSYECYWKWKSKHLRGTNSPSYKRVATTCSNCDTAMEVKPSSLNMHKHNFCSQECYWKFRGKHYRGENHPLYGQARPELIESSRERILKMYEDGVFERTTLIQKAVNSLLEKMGISYQNEKKFKYYSVDNYIEGHNLIIEVMGDYWHVNPLRYKSLDKVNNVQLDMIRRDKAKQSYIRNYHDIKILYLWESDIKNNRPLCEMLIKEYIRSEGAISNYHSFNYVLDAEGNLVLEDNPIIPYFEHRSDKK